MKIGIDARMYGAQKNRGIGRYIEKLLFYLQKIDKVNDYIIFLKKDNWDLFQSSSSRFHKELLDIPWYSAKEQIMVPFFLNKFKFDLVHFPHFNVPLFYRRPYVVTIHDLIMTHFSTNRATTGSKFIYWQKIKVARYLVKQATRRAEAVITPTNYVKEEVKNKLRISPAKIFTIYEGVDQLAAQAGDLSGWPIVKPFFLYVGSAYPHKNLEFLVKTFKKFNQSRKWQLVLVGRLDFFYQRLEQEVIGQDSDIIIRSASNEELVALYQKAVAFVFPSLAEGFGLPPLEAMSQGCPVVASGASCLPEVLGRAVLYFDPTNQASLLAAWQKIVKDYGLATELKEKGRVQVKDFSWQKMAEQTLTLYQTSVK